MNGSASLQHIDAVDAFSRTLFLRAQQHRAPPLSCIPPVVHQLHLALRHLRVEAADPDSPLNGAPDELLHVRQVQPLVRDCEATLRQLESLLDTYDASTGGDPNALADRLAAVRLRLDNDRATVDMLLDSVQLSSPPDAPLGGAALADGPDLERIKDKVDAIAARLFGRQDVAAADADTDEDRLWQDFKSELEKEGFSPQVLRQHKEVLRAYIRELESTSSLTGGPPPTVRGLLEKQQARGPPLPPKELIRLPADADKRLSAVAGERVPSALVPGARSQNENHSFSSSDGANAMAESTALISTKDLMTMDSLRSGMAGLHLQDHTQHLGSSPRGAQKYLTGVSPNSSLLGTSPAIAQDFPSQPDVRPPPQPPSGSSARQPSSRLAPDRYGNEIPMDAQWTKIRRSLVSPEVLERAGVRYEARPDFVAVLGCLTREQVAEYGRQSTECRAARSDGHMSRGQHDTPRQRHRSDSKSSREDDDDESVLWDEGDSTDYDDDKTSDRGTKSYPYIVSPPSKNKTSPASTVMPKPILKNKNENHVRFDPEPHEVEPKSPRRSRDERDERDERDRRGDQAARRRRDHRDREGAGGRSRDESRREGERRGADRERRGSDRHQGSGEEHHRPRRGGDRDRRGGRRGEWSAKKKAWGGTLGAVGIGGAAASLLGVLTEAAIGM